MDVGRITKNEGESSWAVEVVSMWLNGTVFRVVFDVPFDVEYGDLVECKFFNGPSGREPAGMMLATVTELDVCPNCLKRASFDVSGQTYQITCSAENVCMACPMQFSVETITTNSKSIMQQQREYFRATANYISKV